MADLKLALNAGSSSLKFAVSRGHRIFLRGQFEHFGQQTLITVSGSRRQKHTAVMKDLTAALLFLKKMLAIQRIKPDVVIHRIVHGGRKLSKPTKLNKQIDNYLNQLIPLAPLHQPVNLQGVAWAGRAWPRAEQWGVFDTAIYRAMPAVIRTYAIPNKVTTKLQIEKYGFHGTSHDWAFRQAAKQLHKPLKKFTIVTVHLGAGSSVTLWRNNRPLDTSMGFTPLSGLVMATRTGDLDPAVPLYLQEQLRLTPAQVSHVLDNESGLFGLCGLKDMRDVMDAAGFPVRGWPRKKFPAVTKKRAKFALTVYIHRLRHYLAAYIGQVDNIQAIVFTGAIGQNRDIQRLALSGLPVARGIRHLYIPADEEQAMINSLPT